MGSVIIIGAGASGLAAGIAAARAGAKVTVLEAQERPGRKLLVTGNGRCNLTNLDPKLAERYYGTGAALAGELLKQYDAEWTMRFFREIGLLTRERDGYVYPYSNQASSVLLLLLLELRRLGGKLKLGERVRQVIDRGLSESQAAAKAGAAVQSGGGTAKTGKAAQSGGSIAKAGKAAQGGGITAKAGKAAQSRDNAAKGEPPDSGGCRYMVETDTWSYGADCVILACGSCAAPSTGACPDGYRLAAALGHTITRLRPALSPLLCPSGFPAQAAGVRCAARVSLPEFGVSETGELQWTKQGISGIVIFQLARFVSSGTTPGGFGTFPRQKNHFLSIDFLPDYESIALCGLLRERAAALGREPVSALLRGFLNEKLIPVVLNKAGETGTAENEISLPKTCAELTESHIRALCQTIKDFRLTVAGMASFEQAQVCAGGVDCRELTGHLESRLHPGLYICGELTDVDGPCGGYNLQWAFAGGYEAGRSAAALSQI